MNRFQRAVFLPLLVSGSVSCATSHIMVDPVAIPALESAAAERPNDAESQRSLGEAYYAAKRYNEALAALQRSASIDSTDQRTRLYVAFSLDALDQFADARNAYQEVRARKPAPPVAKAITERLMVLDRREAVVLARHALEQESTVGGEAAGSYTVAVLPLQYTGTDSTLKPLEKGLAHLLVTDLASVQRLTLVERVQVQALLDEMKLGESDRVDPVTAARSGRLLRAGRVVQGTIGDREPGQLAVNATVIEASTASVAATATAQDRLQALFDLEKQVVFAIIEQMGVELAPAERARIAERPTQNVQAFLAYSRGLEAESRGNYMDALGSFREALTLDPSFNAAKSAVESSAQLSRGAAVQPDELAPQLSASASNEGARQRLRETVSRVTPSGGDQVAGAVAGGNDRDNTNQRKGVQEGTDTQGATDAARTTTITITVTRPGNTP